MAVATSTTQPARRSGLRIFAYAIGGLLLLAALAVAGIVLFPPTGFIKSQVAAAVKKATGRDLTIAGPAGLKFTPDLALHLELVSLSGVPGGADLLKADSVDANIKLWPLIGGRVEVHDLKMVKPAIAIVSADLAPPVAAAAAPEAKAPPPSAAAAAFVLSKLTVTDGIVSIFPDDKGTVWKADQLSATASRQANGSFVANGSFRANNEAAKFETTLSNPNSLVASGASPVQVSLTAKPAVIGFSGDLVTREGGALTGGIDVKTASIQDLAKWIGVSPAILGGTGAAELEGKLSATRAAVRIEDAKVQHPAGTGTGFAEVRLDGPRPAIKASIASPSLDLNKLMPGEPAARAASLESAAVSPEDASLNIPAGWESLAAELGAIESGQTAAGVERSLEAAAASSNPWSAEQIDFGALQAADIDVTVAAGKIAYGKLPMQAGDFAITNRDGRLDVDVKKLEIDKGKASGKLSLDSAAKPPKATLGMTLEGISADRLLATLFDRRLLTGDTSAEVSLTASGASQRDLVGSLNGAATLRVGKGAITGFNLRRSVLEWWNSWAYDPKQKTPFEKLDANYTVTKGVLRNTGNLLLEGPDINITSEGSVSLLSRTLNQAVSLKLAPPPPAHLPIPVKVTGNWSAPKISWDWGAVFAAPERLAAPPSLAASQTPIPNAAKSQLAKFISADTRSAGLSSDARALVKSWVEAAPAAPK